MFERTARLYDAFYRAAGKDYRAVSAGELTAEVLLTSDGRAAAELLDTAQAVRVRTGLGRDAHEQKHYRGVLGRLGLDEGAPRGPASTDGLADLLMSVTRGPFRARR